MGPDQSSPESRASVTVDPLVRASLRANFKALITRLVSAATDFLASRPEKTGVPKLDSTPMMAITIISSISVMPRLLGSGENFITSRSSTN